MRGNVITKREGAYSVKNNMDCQTENRSQMREKGKNSSNKHATNRAVQTNRLRQHGQEPHCGKRSSIKACVGRKLDDLYPLRKTPSRGEEIFEEKTSSIRGKERRTREREGKEERLPLRIETSSAMARLSCSTSGTNHLSNNNVIMGEDCRRKKALPKGTY